MCAHAQPGCPTRGAPPAAASSSTLLTVRSERRPHPDRWSRFDQGLKTHLSELLQLGTKHLILALRRSGGPSQLQHNGWSCALGARLGDHSHRVGRVSHVSMALAGAQATTAAGDEIRRLRREGGGRKPWEALTLARLLPRGCSLILPIAAGLVRAWEAPCSRTVHPSTPEATRRLAEIGEQRLEAS